MIYILLQFWSEIDFNLVVWILNLDVPVLLGKIWKPAILWAKSFLPFLSPSLDWFCFRCLLATCRYVINLNEVGNLYYTYCQIKLLIYYTFTYAMQKYLQSLTVRVEEMRVKRMDAEQWMSHRMLPDHLRDRIRRYEQYRWQETRGVDEESLISNLPKDLRRDINRHLCWSLLKRVSTFPFLN